MVKVVENCAPPVASLDGGLVIAWKRECYRTIATSRTFDAPVAFVQNTRGSGKIAKAIGYMRNFIATAVLLARKRPKVVICLNQPPFLPVVCAIYSLFSGAPVIMDFHSGALSSAKWRAFRPFYRWLVRRAPFTIVHNRRDGSELISWGGQVLHLLSLPQDKFPDIRYEPRTGRPQIFFVCSFASDEPIKEALQAMRDCPEIDFVLSGDFRKAGLAQDDVPSNIHLAGFLDYDIYLQTMAHSTAVLTLSKRTHIMQMAVEEALTIGVPVITNTSPTLSEVLQTGSLLAPIEVSALSNAFREAVQRHAELSVGILAAKQSVWLQNGRELAKARSMAPNFFMQS